MQQPDFNLFLEVKELKEDGSFRGIASMYDVEDLGGDIIEKGAFKKTLAENSTVPILWQHDSARPIGSGEVKEAGSKIVIQGKLLLSVSSAREAYELLREKIVKGLSIGFQSIRSKFEELEEDGKTRYLRRIQELKLWEVSVVTFPMLPQAQVTIVKTAVIEDRIRELEEKLQALQVPPESAVDTSASPTPSQTEEPPPVAPIEPMVNHSLAQSILSVLRS
jgi:uncharacterized protein